MVLLPGCKCCGGGGDDCWYCWERTNGPPNFVFRTCDTSQPTAWPSFEWQTDGVCHDNESECRSVCRPDDPPPPPERSRCYYYYNNVGFVPSERLRKCPDESSSLVDHINAQKGNMTRWTTGGYILYEFEELICVDYQNPLPVPPPNYDYSEYFINRVSWCNSEPPPGPWKRCEAYWNNEGTLRDLKVGGRAYSSDPAVVPSCIDLICRGQYEELKVGLSLGPFEYCQDCSDPAFKSKESRAMQTPTQEEIMPTTTKTTGGPGTELKRLLGSFGIKSKEKGCGCRSMQAKMDRPGWAESHKEEIINHLAAEAKKRRLPFIRLAAEKLVDLAIRRANIRK